MMIYRSLVVGLLGAIAMLLAEQGAALERAGARPACATERALVRDHRDVGVDAGFGPGRHRAVPGGDDHREPSREIGYAPQTIVHISKTRAGDDPIAALGLGEDLRPVAIDGHPFDRPWREALRDRWTAARPGTYFELWLLGPVSRRMLVLITR